MTANVFTIPAGTAFAEALVRGIVGEKRDPLVLADVTIYLPTRRAMRTLAETFARVLGGAALLPQIRPLGDVDEDDFLFDTEDLLLPPVIEPVRRRLLLAALVQRWDSARDGERMTFAQAASAAQGLAQFLDEVERQGADLGRLETLAPAALAQHWSGVQGFLALLRDEWPNLLAAEGAIDHAAYSNRMLAALTQKYLDHPPECPVIAAGTTGSIPATARLLSAIAQLPKGAVILPGLDRDLDEASWNDLDPGHAQYGMKQLLERIGIARAEVRDWPGAKSLSDARVTMLRETLRPAPTTDAWRALAESGSDIVATGLDRLTLVEAAHPGEEATAIALILREALETRSATAALVTPDRNLARRVAAELGRWDIAIDDSAGTPLGQTPPGAFLALLADAADAGFAPASLLALLKHPLASGRQSPGEFRHAVRELDRFALRGPRPDAGLRGIARAIAGKPNIAGWFARVAEMLQPFADAMQTPRFALAELAALHVAAAEQLAASDAEEGAQRFWRGDAGDQAAQLMRDIQNASADLSDIETSSYPHLFRALAQERAVRPAYGRHPRLAILGPLEARLQHFDTIVLSGLNEGTWPQSPPPDPWLSRPMRAALGLESPERAIGRAAHDFATLAAGPRVVLTRALKSDGAPTIASRWLQRLKQLTGGLQLEQRLTRGVPYAAFAQTLSTPDGCSQAEKRPAPCPPVSLRPRSLSVTEIETWIRDPYAIYAKHILKLKPLDPLDAEIGPLERGSAIHAALEQFLKVFPGELPHDAEAQLVRIADEVFAKAGIPKAALALWRPRLVRAAKWFAAAERERRPLIAASFVEVAGKRAFAGPAGEFVLRGRADRIDILHSGGAAIIDYKTGAIPTDPQVEAMLSPQLPLEGAILAEGGFPNIAPIAPEDFIYVRFGGGVAPGDYHRVERDASALVRKAEGLLIQRIADFDHEATPYHPRVAPARAAFSGDYDHLARVREWSLSGWKEDAS